MYNNDVGKGGGHAHGAYEAIFFVVLWIYGTDIVIVHIYTTYIYIDVCMYVYIYIYIHKIIMEEKNEINDLKTRLARLEAKINSSLIVDGITKNGRDA